MLKEATKLELVSDLDVNDFTAVKNLFLDELLREVDPTRNDDTKPILYPFQIGNEKVDILVKENSFIFKGTEFYSPCIKYRLNYLGWQ